MRKLLILALLCPYFSMCQPLSINGKIINEDMEPVAGATVVLKRTGQTTVSDKSGAFYLTNLQLHDTLLITAVGYAPATEVLQFTSRDRLTIVLTRKTAALDDVMVMAYGATTKRMATGSITRISADEISRQPVSNPLAALQDRVPGLLITQSAGLPGAAFSVQLRGRTSLVQSSEPLFIIDGVPFAPGNTSLNVLSSSLTAYNEAGGMSPLQMINPADIESIEILKDADATAIYGSRGANGVILISTKKGKAGGTIFSLNLGTGFSRATRLMQMMNTQQYLEMRHEAFQNDGVTPTTVNAYDLLLFDTTRYTDFSREFYGGTAATHNFQGTLSGGNEYTRFLIGAGYNKETTILPGSLGNQRGSTHFRLDHSSQNHRFNSSFILTYTYDRNNLVSNNFSQLLLLPPNYPSFLDEKGALVWDYKGVSLLNPYAYLKQSYVAETANLVYNMQVHYAVSDRLRANVSLGYNSLTGTEENKNPLSSYNPANNPTNSASFGNSSYSNWIIEPQLHYNIKSSKGSLQILIGSSFQSNLSKTQYITGAEYPNDALLGSLDAAGTIIGRRNSLAIYRYSAAFGRMTYNYNNKYLLNLSGRTDGSSRFGPGHQWGNFGSAGLAWIFSEESFLKRTEKISFGKLRASYGTSGNDKIGDYQFLNSWSATSTYQGNGGLAPTALFNPDYHWETNRKLEAALELGFAENRFLINVTYYRTHSTGQLIQYKLPIQTGFTSVIQNFPATVQNQGWEIEVNTETYRSKALRWSTGFQLSLPENKLLSFPGLETSSYSHLSIGEPLSTYIGYRYLGVNPSTGLYELTDKNDKVITSAASADRIANLGNTEPILYGSFSNELEYNNWQLAFLFGFKKGDGINYLYQLSTKYPGTINNMPIEVLNRWQKPGDDALFQKYTQSFGAAGQAAALFAQVNSNGKYGDASYVRLRNVSLSYSVPVDRLNATLFRAIRFSLQAQNLITWTAYQGGDPENQNVFTLPPLRTIMAGLQINF